MSMRAAPAVWGRWRSRTQSSIRKVACEAWVEGLRVVDASIMPEVPRANTHLTAVMLAEHLAEGMQRATS
jgi:choline dehydrogenase-like flavoprotein